jgi:hypothetical protein
MIAAIAVIVETAVNAVAVTVAIVKVRSAVVEPSLLNQNFLLAVNM